MDRLESLAVNGSSAAASSAVLNGSCHAEVDTSSVEYLLDRQCRIEETCSGGLVGDLLLTKDTERGEGSDSGVEFGASNTTNHHLRRLSSNEEEVAPSANALQESQRAINLQEVAQKITTTTDESELIFCGSTNGGLLQRHNVFAATTTTATSIEGQFSCDSSMLSFCSEENLLDGGDSSKCVPVRELQSGGGDCASEGGGSESSSVYNHPVMACSSSNSNSAVKKRVNVMEASVTMARNMSVSTTQLSKQMEGSSSTLGRAKFRAVSVSRVGPPSLLTKDRARSKERGQLTGASSSSSPLVRAHSLRRPPKPDSLPVSSPMAPPAKRMSTLTRTQSVRTPGSTPTMTTTDSGRWPYGPQTPRSTGTSRNNNGTESLTFKTRLGQMSLEQSSAQSTFDKYATMPRRRRERSADQKVTATTTESSTRSSSISRDRMNAKMSISTQKLSTPVAAVTTNGTPKMRSVVRRFTQKIKIFQETSSQTAITSEDLANAFERGGAVPVVDVTQRDKKSIGLQSEIRDREMDELRRRVKHLVEEQEQLRSALGGKTILLASVEQQLKNEKEAKLKLQKELQGTSERVVAILEQHSGVIAAGDSMMDSTDSLMMLETKVTTDSQKVTRQKYELKKMRNVCTALRQELDDALERERSMIAERESEEMQEFLQIEKSVLTDAAKGEEKAKWQNVVEKKDQEIKWLLEECRHLVRFCEQRRQENMGMQAKYGALEIKSKEMLVQQGNAVSGASVALNSLGTRLEQLVEQLIASYNISEQELEDVVFHNEAFPDSDSSNGNGSCTAATPDDENCGSATGGAGGRNKNDQDLSPQRSHSFINVVINAIRNATLLKRDAQGNISHHQQLANGTEERKQLVPKQIERIQEEEASGIFGSKMEDGSDGSTDMLDSETEPCLMMENVLSDSRGVPVSNAATSAAADADASIAEEGDDDVLLEDDEDNSLNNLSQAISNRQQIELQTSQMLNVKSFMMLKQQRASSLDEDMSHASSIAEDQSARCENCTNSQAIIEQVISVDNLITKLLKVLRIVQLDNDNCIQHLVREKNKLQENKTETEDKIRDCEDVNENLKCQLTTMTQQLLDTEEDLNMSKMELQNCRQEIDKLNHHICELSTLCSNKENNNQTNHTTNECLDNNNSQSTTRGIEGVLKAVLRNIDNGGECKKLGAEMAEGELYNNIMSLLKSNRELRAELSEQNRNPNINWQLNAISDLKRLYEVIDGALEVLNDATPAVIDQYPALGKLQQDLEETNFTLATTLPSYMAIMVSLQQRDQNANPTTGGSVTLAGGGDEEKATGGGGASPAIDSMA